MPRFEPACCCSFDQTPAQSHSATPFARRRLFGLHDNYRDNNLDDNNVFRYCQNIIVWILLVARPYTQPLPRTAPNLICRLTYLQTV